MTRIVIAIAAIFALSVACGGSDGDEITPTPSPDAREILQLSDGAMNMLTSVKEEVTGGNAPTTLLYEAPDRSQGDSAAGKWSRCVAGSRAWERQLADDGTWGLWALLEETAGEWEWPDYRRLLRGFEVEDLRFVEEAAFAGEEVWVITYDYTYLTYDSSVPSTDTEWIAKETHWLLKAEHWQDDPLGFTGTTTTVYSRHDESQDIECPVPSDDGAGGG